MRPSPLAFPEREPASELPAGANAVRGPRADGAVTMRDLTVEQVAEMIRSGHVAGSGAVVNVESAMRVAVAYRCTHILAGACGNLPIDLYQRTGEGNRQPATNHPLRAVLQRPNAWQTSSEFRKMLTAHAVLKGNGYALKITSRGRLLALWPLNNPDRMEVCQDPDTMRLQYRWRRDNGSYLQLDQAEVLHLRGLTFDGIKGMGVIAYARQALGLALQGEQAAGGLFRQGVIGGQVFTTKDRLSDEAFGRLKQQIEENNAGAENARKALILEEDLKVDSSLMSGADLEFLAGRGFQRSDVGMFFGVPPHMYGDTEKTAAPVTGLETIGASFVTYTANDWFVMWEEALARDCLTPAEVAAGYYVRLQRQALLRGDLKSRTAAYTSALQWGWMSPDEVRALEDMNPRADGEGGQYYDPPNTAGSPANDPKDPADA